MINWCFVLVIFFTFRVTKGENHLYQKDMDKKCCDVSSGLTNWKGTWEIFPSMGTFQNQLPKTPAKENTEMARQERGKYKVKKKFKKFLLPLLLAYKLKFFTLIPVMIGGLVLLTGATGLAGFFFALFAATMGLKGGH